MKLTGAVLFLTTLLSACAHLPSDDEKNTFRAQQSELKKIETVMYNGKETGLYDQLKTCSMQLHDRVNPEEVFEWSESVDKHPDVDYFSDPDHDVSRADFNMLVEKYKIYRQYSAARKDNYEHRLHYCQADLKAAMRREKIRSQQEQALLDKLSDAEKASRPAPAPVPAPEPAAVTPAPAAPAAPEGVPVVAPAPATAPAAAPAKKAAQVAPAAQDEAAPEEMAKSITPVKSAGPSGDMSLEDEFENSAPKAPHAAMPRKVNAGEMLGE